MVTTDGDGPPQLCDRHEYVCGVRVKLTMHAYGFADQFVNDVAM